jgi:hypothetical protein
MKLRKDGAPGSSTDIHLDPDTKSKMNEAHII